MGGRYQIQRVLGEGGFGITYLAQDTQRPGAPTCVIKRLCPVRGDARFLQLARRLFNTEAEILAQLGNYDQIPQLLAYFEQDYQFYLVQDYIRGHALSQELAPRQPWPDGAVVALLQDLLQTLTFVHDRHVIHRDLKPSNVIRREDGRLVLIDFGAVKHLNPLSISHPASQSGDRPNPGPKTIAIGTPGYAAPEQMAGHPRFNSDLYALGMIAIQAMTGIPPHALKTDLATGDPIWQPLVQAAPTLVQIVMAMTEFNACDRYGNAKMVLQDLQTLKL